MNVRQYDVELEWIGMALVGVVFGVSLVTGISADPVVIPGIGSVHGVVAGGAGVLLGSALYTLLPDCGCSGGGTDGTECGCDGQCEL